MIDTGQRIKRNNVPLAEVITLQGRQLEFDSIAQMVTTRAKESPEATMVLYDDQVISYSQINDRANQVAHFLMEKGVGRGDMVSCMILNSPEVYYAMFGAQKIGAVAGAVNYMLKPPEIAYVLDDSKPKVIFASSEYMADVITAIDMAKHKPSLVEVVTDAAPGALAAERTMEDIIAHYPATECLVPQELDDPALLLYSSGTTGMPKGILISNRNELCICKGKAAIGTSLPGDIMMIILPMFHTNPLCVWTYPSIYQGLTLCIRRVFSPKDFWPALMQYGVTIVQGVPAMYDYIYQAADPATIDYDKVKLRLAYSGAAPMPVSLVQAFKEKFNVEVVDGYGLTEATGVSTTCAGVEPNWESIGVAFPFLEVEIMDGQNTIVPTGDTGEICVRGDAVMLGYLNKPEATAESLVDGWLHTGDMGHMDEKGYVYIAGRIKEMINRGGENIYPREVEIPLENHPKIAEVAVVGAPDPALGERVHVCIVLHESESLTLEEIQEYLSDKIAKYKIPESVNFMKEFPRNPTGKILKHRLKEMD